MRVLLLALTALLAAAVPAHAGQKTAAATEPSADSASAIDASRLPINPARISRQIRQTVVREERNGLRLRYTVEVYGELPRIQFITPLDNILTGDVPMSSPTHADMLRMMTPQEFSSPVIGIVSVPRKK